MLFTNANHGNNCILTIFSKQIKINFLIKHESSTNIHFLLLINRFNLKNKQFKEF